MAFYLALLRDPAREWAFLRSRPADPKAVYYFLIFPLCALLGIVTFWSQVQVDGAVSAGIYFLIKAGIPLLMIVSAALLIFCLVYQWKGTIMLSQVHASIPYVFVPWLAASIISAALSEILPVLAGILSLFLYAAAIFIGAYLLYFYCIYYLLIPPTRRLVFFGLSCLGMALLLFVFYWVEYALIDAFVIKGF